MNEYKLTADINPQIDFNKVDSSYKESIDSILNYIDVLYSLNKIDNKIINFEDYYFKKILDELSNCANNSENSHLYSLINSISSGIYDLISIPFKKDKKKYADLILGKVFSPDKGNKKMFAGGFGLVNQDCDSMLKDYDEEAEAIYSNFPFINQKVSNFLEIKSEIKCLDILRFSGDFNKRNKPISIFYSGKSSDNVSALSKVIVFTNIYFERFKIISSALGKKYINDFNEIDGVEKKLIDKIQLYWLRGHDLGHFFGEDNLGIKMSDNKKLYYILHELKSDIISLYILKNYSEKFFGENSKKIVFLVIFAEMLRYIRRGNYMKYADSGSALVAFKYFRKDGIKIDANNTITLNIDAMDECTDILCKRLCEMFENGDYEETLNFITKYCSINELSSSNLPKEIDFISDYSIPYNINIG